MHNLSSHFLYIQTILNNMQKTYSKYIPARAWPWAWAGPGAAWYFVLILYILDILDVSWMYLDICLVYFG